MRRCELRYMSIEFSDTEMESWMRDWSPTATTGGKSRKKAKLDPFLRRQQVRLLQLRQRVVESISGVGEHTRANCGAPVWQTHQADVATEVNDRDLALGLLSHEHDALYEIDQALQRIDSGTYGICEMSGKQIPSDRLEAIPFARFTVECQSQLEKEYKASRLPHSRLSLLDLAVTNPDDEEKMLARSDED